jgi:hypothetical protein
VASRPRLPASLPASDWWLEWNWSRCASTRSARAPRRLLKRLDTSLCCCIRPGVLIASRTRHQKLRRPTTPWRRVGVGPGPPTPALSRVDHAVSQTVRWWESTSRRSVPSKRRRSPMTARLVSPRDARLRRSAEQGYVRPMPRPKVGDIVEINLPDGQYAYGRVLRDASIGIYRGTLRISRCRCRLRLMRRARSARPAAPTTPRLSPFERSSIRSKQQPEQRQRPRPRPDPPRSRRTALSHATGMPSVPARDATLTGCGAAICGERLSIRATSRRGLLGLARRWVTGVLRGRVEIDVVVTLDERVSKQLPSTELSTPAADVRRACELGDLSWLEI